MARRETPIQHMKVKIVNIVLYPTKRQVKDIYVDMFRKIFEDKRTINTTVIDGQEYVLFIFRMMRIRYMVILLIFMNQMIKR